MGSMVPRTLLAALALAGCTSPDPGAGPGNAAEMPLPDLLDREAASADLARGAPVFVREVRGAVVDDQGMSIGKLLVTVCAQNCYFGKTDEQGRFAVAIGETIRVQDYAVDLHGSPERASYYTPVPPLAGDLAVFERPLLLLPLPASGPPIQSGSAEAQVLDAGGATLSVPAHTEVMLSVEDFKYKDGIGGQFRPLRIPAPERLPFVDPGAPPQALYALAPFEARLNMPARLSLSVSGSGLAPGTAVEFQRLRGLLLDPPPAGHFETLGSGRISQDGQRAEMDAGSGLTGLTWIAIRTKGT